jgi:uncharacterized protein with von Willebrand factor type A (vWA) domain
MIEAFAAALRGAGLRTDGAALAAYERALNGDPELGPFGLYWYGRLTLVHAIEDVPAFDRAFTIFFGAPIASMQTAPAQTTRGPAVAQTAEPARERESTLAVDGGAERPDRAEDATADAVVTASERERLVERDFASFSDADWRLAERIMRERRIPEEFRSGRRHAIRRHGRRLDVGETLREEARTFGLRARPRYRVRTPILRPLVFVCDVSGSMAPYGRALLQYAFVLARARPKVATFAFGTRLTELTRPFARGMRATFADALRVIPDWGGGTLIGASLRALNRSFAPQARVRGATMLIVSDGAERSDPAPVGREMAQLARTVRRIVWLNPRKSDPAFEPLVRGMLAAMPFVDTFLSGHNLRSLDTVAAVIGGASKDNHHA